MMEKIGISTVYTGYNYGSSLQAFAVKKIVEEMGYDAILLSQRKNTKNGRDIRIKKFTTMLWKSVVNSSARKRVKSYRESIRRPISLEAREKFDLFKKEYLCPKYISYRNLRKVSADKEYKAFICGSDQIWNASTLYVDPFYYLRYAPIEKRISFAPSFGRSTVPDYNRVKISKYLSEIPNISVRENSGVEIVQLLTGKTAVVIPDPTLILSHERWKVMLGNLPPVIKRPYVLLYFLDTPSDFAKKKIEELIDKYGIDIVSIPNDFVSEKFSVINYDAGPAEFINLVENAEFICTDSFHGTAFAVNFNIPFYTFERQYGSSDKQSSRIESLLNIVKLESRFNPVASESPFSINFSTSNFILEHERTKAEQFLKKSLNSEMGSSYAEN